jgi:predicted nucleotidyltransferase
MLAAGDTFASLLESYPWLEQEDLQACMLYALKLVEQVPLVPSFSQLQHRTPEVIQQAPYLKLLVLFGSRASDRFNPNSDWDFAILCDENLRKDYENMPFGSFRIWSILEQVFEIKDDKVDVVDLHHCDPTIAYRVAKDGKLLYEQTAGDFTKFKCKAWKIFADTQKFRDLQRKGMEIGLRRLGV